MRNITADRNKCSTTGISVCKISQICFVVQFVVAGVCGKHLKDENESICGKYHTKQIEKTPNREPHLYGTPGIAL